MRVFQGGQRGEASAFAPIERPRLTQRLAAASKFPIALLVAPAGYGKSVVLRQYFAGLDEPSALFALRPEHGGLLGFLRGFAEALGEHAPHVITTLAGAYERTTSSTQRAADLARWMQAHLESFNGCIAIDDLHVADGEADVGAFVATLIERTKGRIRWILASRSMSGLPLGTWLAYRDADLPIGEEDLRFTLDEVRSAARTLGLSIGDEELIELLALTEGWPAAMSFALRTSTRSSELRNISAITREMIYRFLAEQVYAGLDDEERALLQVAIALPSIDVAVLERAGFDRALPIVERLRERTAFIYEETPGVYQCHDLFREFLRHEGALAGKRAQQAVHERAARALEESGDMEHALPAYVLAGSAADIVRLLEEKGFELLERARGDIVARAIDSLDEKTRRENPTVLALQGTLQAIAGKFSRAESLLRRSLARAGADRDLVAIASLRLAAIVGNKGNDVTEILEPLSQDGAQTLGYRAEALSLLAAQKAIGQDVSSAVGLVGTIYKWLPTIESDITRAKILHHLGIVHRHAGDHDRAEAALAQASELATELHLYSVASRANAVRSNLALHSNDDVDLQLKYAEAAALAASKSGDAFALQTALLQVLSAHMRRGNVEKSVAVEHRINSITMDDAARRYIKHFGAVRLAWDGDFSEARKVMIKCWNKMHFDFDRIFCGGQCALFLALDSYREDSKRLVEEVLMIAGIARPTGAFGRRSLAIGVALCGIAEVVNERFSHAERIFRSLNHKDGIINIVVSIGKSFLRRSQRFLTGYSEIAPEIERLAALSYGDVARLLRATVNHATKIQESNQASLRLTPSERHVLRLLASGMVPKEIASETERSVNTVRVHIANAIEKLGCHGRAEAVSTARYLGVI
ncbi:MAG: AAA family ATPase [Candidatus Eremiobacteraeota bacterium]|nr:AAA family ATPase [Candidatus Eremiobacteraeota bacterium]